MNQTLQIFLGLPGLVLLCYGAEFLGRGGVRLAEALHIPKVVVGLTLVAFATSAPELVVSIDSAIRGVGDISVGNVVGSNICNIGLILGVASLITPMNVSQTLLRFDMPLLTVATVLLAVCGILLHGVNRVMALVFLGGFFLYSWKNVREGMRGETYAQDGTAKSSLSVPMALLLAGGGVAALLVGAKLFVNGAIELARLFHVSDAVIGLTLVAIGTSLPELATSVVAAFKGEKEIAVGNVVGSNIFNILAILGIAPLISPIQAAGIQIVDMSVMLGITLLMFVMMFTGKVVRRGEGALLLCVYLGYSVWLFVQGG